MPTHNITVDQSIKAEIGVVRASKPIQSLSDYDTVVRMINMFIIAISL